MNFIILFVKSILESLNVLYFSKDLKVFLRMPIKEKDILQANILNMIISEYQMEALMLAIPLVVYGLLTKVTFIFYLYMFLVLLILPVIPIIFVSVIISIIMRFTNIIKDKNMVTYITIGISLVILVLLSITLNNTSDMTLPHFQALVFRANGLADELANRFILIKPIMNIFANYNNINGLKNLIIYFAENIIVYILGIHIMSLFYLKGAIGTTFNAKKKSEVNQELVQKDFKQKKIWATYLNKEFVTIQRTPIFLIQCLIVPVLDSITIFIIVIAFVKFLNSSEINAMQLLNNLLLSSFGMAIFLGIGQFLYMMNFNSSIAISKDSKNAKLIKYLPIDLYKQFKYKLTLGTIINSLTAIILSICSYILCKNIENTIFILITLLLLSHIGEMIKLLIDLRNPKTTWTSEFTMMKENTNVMYILFYTIIIVGVQIGLAFLVKNYNIYRIIVLIVAIIVDLLFKCYIKYHKNKIFENVY